MADVSRNNMIVMHRGDTAVFYIYTNIGSKREPLLYEMREKDNLYFALMEPNQPWEKAIIRKAYDYQDFDKDHFVLPVRFSTEDTEYLVPGTYYYQVKLRRDRDNVDDCHEVVETIIPKTKFIIVD